MGRNNKKARAFFHAWRADVYVKGGYGGFAKRTSCGRFGYDIYHRLSL